MTNVHKKLMFSFIVTLSLFLTACVSSNIEQAQVMKDDVVRHHSEESSSEDLHDNFMKLFENASQIGVEKTPDNFLISDQVMDYISSCCRNRDGAIFLLKKNGFTVYTGGKYNPAKPDSDKPYDEYIFGEKHGPRMMPYLAHKTYRVFLYIKNGQVDHVLAHVFIDAI